MTIGSPVLSPDTLLRVRMRAQRLARGSEAGAAAEAETGDAGAEAAPGEPATGAERVADAARHMFAVQGQDWRSSRWALGVRAPGTTDSDVLRAFDGGLLVRAWPMRGTLHVMPAEDIGWIQRATNHRVLPGAPRRREYLGLADTTLERLVDVTVEALRGGRSLDRSEVAALWTDAGIAWQGNWRYHVLWWMCQNGITTFGPVGRPGSAGDRATDGSATEPRLVLADEWIRSPRSLDGDEALAEIAARYATPRGAVTAKDLAWWSGLTVREARRALTLAQEDGRLALMRVDVGGAEIEHWGSPAVVDAARSSDRPQTPVWLLLPAFDEHLLGYTDRGAQLAPEHFSRVVPGKNGMFLATVVRSGRVVGTWKRGTRKTEPITTTPLPGETVDSDGLSAPLADWQRFGAADAEA